MGRPLVLITGATGFIGRRLVKRVIADGARVRALLLPDETPLPELATLPGADVELVRGDVTNAASVDAAVRGTERVYHLAAVVGDWGPEALFERVNVGGTRNVLAAAAAHGCARVAMVSSIVVYGSQLRTGECDEDAPREHGVGPYSRTKRRSEDLAIDADRFGRVPVTIIRPGNVYGPNSGVWVDEVVALLRRGMAPLLDDGEGDAELAYVDNVVDVIARAAVSPHGAGRIYNACDGDGVSWRRYLSDLAGLAGAPPPTRTVPAAVAAALAPPLERAWRLARRKHRPLLTREAVQLLASRVAVPIERAIAELGYRPIPYDAAMVAVGRYIQERA